MAIFSTYKRQQTMSAPLKSQPYGAIEALLLLLLLLEMQKRLNFLPEMQRHYELYV